MPIGIVAGGIVEPAWTSLAGDTVALDVAQVRPCRAEIACLLARVACPDDDTPRTRHEEARSRNAALRETTSERVGSNMTCKPRWPQTNFGGLAHDAFGVSKWMLAAGITDAAKLRCEVAVGHEITSLMLRQHEVDGARLFSRRRQIHGATSM